MTPDKLKTLTWVPLDDWDNCYPTYYYGNKGKLYFSQSDIMTFVYSIIREVSFKLDMSFQVVEDIFNQKNELFRHYMEEYFKICKCLNEKEEEFKNLTSSFMVPNLQEIIGEDTGSNVKKIINIFSTLTDFEKAEVLKELGMYTIIVQEKPISLELSDIE